MPHPSRYTALITLLISFALLSYTKMAYAQGNERPPTPVPVLKVQQVELPFYQTYPVRLEAFQEVDVHARITANIEKQFYREGQTVNKGQLLYKLDDRRAKAAYEVALANLANAKVRAKNAEVTYKRTQKLLNNRSVSEQVVDDAFAEYQATQTSLQAAEAQVQSAKIELDDTTIEAEITGVIGQRQQDVGDLVDPLSGKTLLNTIRQTRRLYGLYSISDRSRQKLFELEDKGTLKLYTEPKVALIDNRDQLIVEGQLTFTDNQIDAATSSQMMRAEFDNPNNRLLPGQLLRVRVEHGQWQNVIQVPQKAVIQNAGQAFVYVAADNQAKMRPIEIAGAYQNSWLVEKGLKPGEPVITGNIIKVRPNAAIKVLPAGDQPAQPAK